MTALNRKLLRDLVGMRGQALAIAAVVGAGVAMYVMYLSNFSSLRETQRAYYASQRFAEVFASLKRAPLAVTSRIGAIPGVAIAEPRVVALATLDMPDLDATALARIVSVSSRRRPALNDLFIRRGRWLDPANPDEILVSEGFAQTHGVAPGDTLTATINGHRRRLAVAGVALSPEFVYTIRPGELIPDDRRFAVFWMDRQALAAAVGLDGAFNDLVISLQRGAIVDDVIERVDIELAPYGGLGAVPRARQLSHWTVENELTQLQQFGFMLPAVFLLVAAFTLNVALARVLALQRPQIAALKALGYDNAAIAWHYLKLALLISTLGAGLGLVIGTWLGSAIGELYNRYFRFPQLLFAVPARVVLTTLVLTSVTAIGGAYSAVRRAVRIAPAEAMRAEPPSGYRRRAALERVAGHGLGMTSRIVLRNLTRRPLRAAASVVGIALGAAVLMIGIVFVDAMDRLIETQFWTVDRRDLTVAFVEPRDADAVRALTRLPGVMAVEPLRDVAVRIQAGPRHRDTVLSGISATTRLRPVVDARGQRIAVPSTGLVLSTTLAGSLDVRRGDAVDIQVLEGGRPRQRLVVVDLVEDLLGLPAFTDGTALQRLLREGDVASGAALAVDTRQSMELARALKAPPAIAAATFKRDVLRSFRETMAANLTLTLGINVVFAAVIAFGVVYNAARVSLSERSHELASLRVLGFTRQEISLILIGELALLTVLALPLGALFGAGIASSIVDTLQSEVYRFPLYISRASVMWAWLGTTLAALVSALIVRRRLDRLDLIAVLKGHE